MKSSVYVAMSVLGGMLASLPAFATSTCDAPPGIWGPFAPLLASQQRLRAGQPVTIVAIGSSSTYGTGATSRKYSYPAQLAAIWSERFPQARIQMINAGIGGETIARNLLRLNRDVLAHRPDLVIWQVGTNDAFQQRTGDEVYTDIQAGIAQILATGADLVLMEAQYFPDRPETDDLRSVRAAIRKAANASGVEILPRYALMQHWIEAGNFSASTMLSADRIHMTNSSYHCLAERVADLLPANEAQTGEIINVAVAPDEDLLGLSRANAP